MGNLSGALKGLGMFYVGRTLLGSHKDNTRDSLFNAGIKQAKFTPFYTAAFFGSTTLLIAGLAFLSYGLGLVLFEGMSSRSDTSFFTGSILSALGFGIKLAIFFVIRKKEKQIMSIKRSAQKLIGIADVFIDTFARELKREQKQFVNDLVETDEVQAAFKRLEELNYSQSGNRHLH